MKTHLFKYCFLASLMGKCLILLILNSYSQSYTFIGGDSHYYLNSIESWVDHGKYTPDFRMPGYGIFYLPFYILFPKTIALKAFLGFQILVSSLGLSALILLIYTYFRSIVTCVCIFILNLIAFSFTKYDFILVSESFFVALFSIWLYTIDKWEKSFFSKKHTLIVSVLLANLIFIKPIFFPVLFFVAAWVLLKSSPPLKKRLKVLAILFFVNALPLLLWTCRNYIVHHKVFLFQKSLHYDHAIKSQYIPSLIEFIKSWGGDVSNPEIFKKFGIKNYSRDLTTEESCYKIPEEIYNATFNADSLLKLKQEIIAVEQGSYNEQISFKIRNEIKIKLERFTKSIQEERKFFYHFKTRFNLTANFLSQIDNFRNRCPIESLSLKECAKSSLYFLNVALVFLGLLGLILIFCTNSNKPRTLLLLTLTLYLILVFPIIFRLSDQRHLTMLLPVFLLGCSKVISWALQKLSSS